jgi:ATP-dependent Clp protease adaptor protein ClpS
MSPSHTRNREEISTDFQQQVTEPPLFRVLMLNDDYTTMEFVVEMLITVFHKPLKEATAIMLNIHHTGSGVCGVFPLEIAETKIATVHSLARENGYPLRCAIEKE